MVKSTVAQFQGCQSAQPVLDARPLHRPHLERERAFLAALNAVAVVKKEDAGAAHGAGLTYRSP